ncbi:MAG TPA: substrate-binding domain-containing protein [Puia sp.]|uniref:LacI family DNA-binding transcriptional regulator n=1 Tax=Puia sp. TaxID=2045100 RepID=UPI002C501BCB|nr:substrate-binding domain-containing protein [Puia sp.]HVU94291.1 substrate-binding domain-containing protein [Puia sp.]
MPNTKKLAVYSPVRKTKRVIGIVVDRLDSPFISTALRGIQKVVAERGYDIIITHSQESADREVANMRLLCDSGTPVIYFGRSGVKTDDARCGYLATEHLIRQGCRRIALVTPGLKGGPGVLQYAGYQDALSRWSPGCSGRLLIMGGPGPEGGASMAERVVRMDPMPDGLVITDDRAAVGCVYALAGAGVRVPEDVAVVGFNNDVAGRMITPALTTVDYPGFEMGKTAAAILFDQLAGLRPARRKSVTVIPPALIIRHSSLRGRPDVVSWP